MVFRCRHIATHRQEASSGRHWSDHRAPQRQAHGRHRRRAPSLARIAAERVVSGKALSTSVAEHCHAINALVTKLEHAERKVDEYQRTIGQHIAAIKEARPKDWEEIVKAECNLGRSRAYELLAIADGRKTVKQVRAADAEKHKRLRDQRRTESGTSRTAIVKVEPDDAGPDEERDYSASGEPKDITDAGRPPQPFEYHGGSSNFRSHGSARPL